MSQREEIIAKVTQHVAERFGGDWNKCRVHYDWSQDELLDATEIRVLLRASGVSRLLAQLAAKDVVAELDTNDDGLVSMAEFLAVFNKPE
jgi:Ca2+-binding EF-hand superfamily protein